MTCKYLIGDHLVYINFCGQKPELSSAYTPFSSDKTDSPLFTLNVNDAFRFRAKGTKLGQADCNGILIDVARCSNGTYQFEISDEQGQLCAILQASSHFTECHAALIAKNHETRIFGLNNVLMIAYAFAAAPFATILIHASVVRNNQKAYLFLGKSGTGKSTHSQLWLKYIPGSDLMNDDNPVVRVKDGKVTVYGSPWSGKTPCWRNVSAEVGAFVNLTQHSKNEIHRQNVAESLASLLPSISTMKGDDRIYKAHCDTIASIITTTPIYHLYCLPDEAAARLCHQTVTQK